MKRWIAIFVGIAILGGSFGGAFYLFLEARSSRDVLIYMQGSRDGRNSCESKQAWGIIPPQGAIEATSLETPMDSGYTS